MATYVIGDIQGCFNTFRRLLDEIKFSQQDKLIILGDMVNRGPSSLETLRYIKNHHTVMEVILGNHDIYLIALALDAIKGSQKRAHTLDPILKASDRDELIEWLRSQPLLRKSDKNLFVHAGILPAVSIDEASIKAEKLSLILKSSDAKKFLKRFYEKIPKTYRSDLPEKKSLRLALNYFTFLRMCEDKNVMDLSYNGSLEKAPKKLTPWFLLRNDADISIYFGHWAALGLYQHGNFYCLDSGCVWGNRLSALRLSDKKVYQVANCE